MAAPNDVPVNGSNEPGASLLNPEFNESNPRPKKRGRKSKAERERITDKLNRVFEDKNGNEASKNGESRMKNKSSSSGSSSINNPRKRGRPKTNGTAQSSKNSNDNNSALTSEDPVVDADSGLPSPSPVRRRGRPKTNPSSSSTVISTSSEATRRRAPFLTSQDNPKKRGRPPKRMDFFEMKPPVELISAMSSSNFPPTPSPEYFPSNGGGATLDMVVTGLQDIVESVKTIQAQVGQVLNFAEQYMGPNGHRR
ncbi:hypothetical protein FO519_006066 [Halicephalobus sp. NKZ332]|nr:hypothetical protein FO519_006066 [Halicephalobus sp. NKZ332]